MSQSPGGDTKKMLWPYTPNRRPISLFARLPLERILRAVQDLAAPIANRHDGGEDRGIELARRESSEEPPVDRHRPHLGVVAPEVHGLGPDAGLRAGRRLLRTGRRGR